MANYIDMSAIPELTNEEAIAILRSALLDMFLNNVRPKCADSSVDRAIDFYSTG